MIRLGNPAGGYLVGYECRPHIYLKVLPARADDVVIDPGELHFKARCVHEQIQLMLHPIEDWAAPPISVIPLPLVSTSVTSGELKVGRYSL